MVTDRPTNPTVHDRESSSRPVHHKSDALTTTPPSHVYTAVRAIIKVNKKHWILGTPITITPCAMGLKFDKDDYPI